jgi:hypothetical protein
MQSLAAEAAPGFPQALAPVVDHVTAHFLPCVTPGAAPFGLRPVTVGTPGTVTAPKKKRSFLFGGTGEVSSGVETATDDNKTRLHRREP